MPEIYIDNEVYAWLKRIARPFEDPHPNDVLRRIAEIDSRQEEKGEQEQKDSTFYTGQDRLPRVNPGKLTNAGLLHWNQILHFRDYSGRRPDGIDAMWTPGGLRFQGEYYSFTGLARKILKPLGHKADNVAGPIFWFTDEGKSVRELWIAYVNSHPEEFHN